MGTIKYEHKVAAPPERTFEVFSNLERAAERVTGIQSLELLTPAPVGIGTRFRETRVMFGKEATEEMEITSFEPGRSYTTEAYSCGCHYKTIIDFLPDGGGTRVVMTMSTTPLTLGAKLFSPLMGVFAKAAMKKCIGADFSELGAFAESQPASA